MRARRVLFTAAGAALLAATSVVSAAGVSTAAPSAKPLVDYHQWTDFHAGTANGAKAAPGGLTIARPAGTVSHTEPGLHTTRRYDFATWTSPRYTSPVAADQLVASWNADTPAGTWLEVKMQATTTAGARSEWYTMGRWAYADTDIQRTSVDGQSDPVGSISTDTFVANDKVAVRSYQLQVTLYRAAGSKVTPKVSLLGAMTSAVPDRYTVPASTPGVARGIELAVPQYAQDLHSGQYPQYGGGGESWCSPTSTEMVVEYYHHRPGNADLNWIDPSYVDPTVDYAARYTYDYAYDGTGNWPFNAAYAAHYGLQAHVTRLNSLSDAEGYIRRGIPVVTSVSFTAAEFPAAGYNTSGHLMVIVGFTPSGDVIVNDPATHADATVRNVYPRRQFENIWLRTKRVDEDGKTASGSGGVAYIYTPR